MTQEELINALGRLEQRLVKCHRLLHDDEIISDEEIAAVSQARVSLSLAACRTALNLEADREIRRLVDDGTIQAAWDFVQQYPK